MIKKEDGLFKVVLEIGGIVFSKSFPEEEEAETWHDMIQEKFGKVPVKTDKRKDRSGRPKKKTKTLATVAECTIVQGASGERCSEEAACHCPTYAKCLDYAVKQNWYGFKKGGSNEGWPWDRKSGNVSEDRSNGLPG